jgi:hypothetical protein
VTAVAIYVGHHDQSIGQETAQVLRHVSTEMWGSPSHWKYICNRVVSLKTHKWHSRST